MSIKFFIFIQKYLVLTQGESVHFSWPAPLCLGFCMPRPSFRSNLPLVSLRLIHSAVRRPGQQPMRGLLLLNNPSFLVDHMKFLSFGIHSWETIRFLHVNFHWKVGKFRDFLSSKRVLLRIIMEIQEFSPEVSPKIMSSSASPTQNGDSVTPPATLSSSPTPSAQPAPKTPQVSVGKCFVLKAIRNGDHLIKGRLWSDFLEILKYVDFSFQCWSCAFDACDSKMIMKYLHETSRWLWLIRSSWNSSDKQIFWTHSLNVRQVYSSLMQTWMLFGPSKH